MSALLATVDITSRHALKLYVEDQLTRIPWDLALYQKSAGSDVRTIHERLEAVDGITRVASLAFLRARFPDLATVSFDVGGKPLTTPWLSLLAATDTSILPTADLREPGPGAVLALVGPERAMGSAFLALQGARDFKLRVKVNDQQRVIFETPLRAVVRLDRDELNRWVMDQTGSVTYIPYIGVILMMPFDATVVTRFDSVASGILPPEVVEAEELEEGHIPLAEYEPEVVFLGRIDRERLISGWDIAGSLTRVADLTRRAGQLEAATAFVVDSTTHVLLRRMETIARLVGVVTILVALPLLWMGWVLAANLCALLMLNERRKLGLLRLRGVPGELMGRAFLLSVVAGGLVGGVIGLVLGSVGPLLAYERGRLPLDVLLNTQQLLFALAFLAVSVFLALAVSRRLIRYATTISPLEASRRVAQSEMTTTLRFGPLQTLALVLGLYTLVVCWILGEPLSQSVQSTPIRDVDRVLNFVGLPLLLYGVATLLASKRATIQRVLDFLVRPIGGSLGHFAVRHLSVKPHRTAAFLLIVALMASVTLYPTITSRSFSDKAERGARVQLGGDLQLLFNAPDIADVTGLRGSLEEQLRSLTPAVEALIARVKQAPGVADATYLYEAVLPQFYLPGYGLRGVPLFLVGEPERYMQLAYSEPVIGLSDSFANVMRPLPNGQVAASPPVADFWKLEPGLPLLVGMDRNRGPVDATASGVLAYLPGIPPRTVTDRQGYVQARIDYLNHLFNSNAYLVSAAATPRLQRLELLIPRVIVLTRIANGAAITDVQRAIAQSLPVRPLEVHDLPAETAKVGTDMFIALALANLRIYLFGGLLLAAIAILAIAVANYTEDKRTLALLRIRGVGPGDMRRFLLSTLLSPAALGLIVGGVTALLGGFGLANYLWELREIRTVVQLLPTHLRTSVTTAIVGVVLVILLVGVAMGFSWWVYRRTASQRVREA